MDNGFEILGTQPVSLTSVTGFIKQNNIQAAWPRIAKITILCTKPTFSMQQYIRVVGIPK